MMAVKQEDKQSMGSLGYDPGNNISLKRKLSSHADNYVKTYTSPTEMWNANLHHVISMNLAKIKN